MSSSLRTATASSARKTNSRGIRTRSAPLLSVALVLKFCPACDRRRFFRVITRPDGTRRWRCRKDHAWESSYFATPAMLDTKGRVHD